MIFNPNFPLSNFSLSSLEYTSLLQMRANKITERPLPIANELDLQAKLFHGEFGNRWKTWNGQEVTVRHFGEWNREAGPDFKNASLQFNDGEVLRGDIEVDLQDTGWEKHGHARNPDFDHVLLHIIFEMPGRRGFARTSDQREVAQVCLTEFTECLVDPYDAASPTDNAPIKNKEAALQLVKSAAEYRLWEKHRHLSISSELHNRRTAIFFSLATALGYKGNQIPFLLLAERSRLPRILKADGEALLFGIAGFLHAEIFDTALPETRAYIKKLWDRWWQLAASEQRLILPRTAWRMHSIRPANHPHRRIGALRELGRQLHKLSNAIDHMAVNDFLNLLKSISHPFWNYHWNLRGQTFRTSHPFALIGSERANDMLVNIFFPSIINSPKGWQIFTTQTLQSVPARVRSARDWLCPAIDNSLLHFAWIQQGLIQLVKDFRGKTSPQNLVKN